MSSLVRYYEWFLTDFNLRLTSKNYSTDSPIFTVGDTPSKFFLQMSFNEQEGKISVFLKRCLSDEGPTQVKAKMFLQLKVYGGREETIVLHSHENVLSFTKGDELGFSFETSREDLLAVTRRGKDTLVVACKTVGLEPLTYFKEELREFSECLLSLRNGNDFNAHLISEGVSIRVHREILSSRSAIFRRQFWKGVDRLGTPFPVSVVEAVLDFLYSGDIRTIDLGSLDHAQVYECALYYGISDLKNLLKPIKTYVSDIVFRKNELHVVCFRNFTKLCDSLYSVEHRAVKMKFDDGVEMRVKLIFGNCGQKITVVTSIENLEDVTGVFGTLFVLDNFSGSVVEKEICLEAENEKMVEFRQEYSIPFLMSRMNSVLPGNALTLQYDLRFLFSGQFSISEQENSEYRLRNHELSDSLVKDLEFLSKLPLSVDEALQLPCRKRSSLAKNTAKTFHISDRSDLTMLDLLIYFYTEVLSGSCTEVLDQLHKVAKAYSFEKLKFDCEQTVMKLTLNAANVLHIYSIAIRAKLYGLGSSCENFIRTNIEMFQNNPQWETFINVNKNATKFLAPFSG